MNPQPTWLEWFVIAIPLSILVDLCCFIVLILIYRPNEKTVIHPLRSVDDPISPKEVIVMVICSLTIFLWCFQKSFEHVIGDMGIISIIPIVCFFGTGILAKEDFNNFLWTVIMLAMGGISLGKAVTSSGLLETIAFSVKIHINGISLWFLVILFVALFSLIATLISHTVSALILLPIVNQIASSLDDPRPRVVVLLCAFMASCAMGLPISGFPNMNAISLEDEVGSRYVSTVEMIKSGVICTLLSALIISSFGYFFCIFFLVK